MEMIENIPNFSHLYSRDGHIWINIKKQAVGQRIRRSLKLIDIVSNWPEARSLQLQIEADIIMKNFDFSFKKYAPKYQRVIQTKSLLELSLSDLWEKYLEFKKKYWSPTTYSNTGLVFFRKFASLECQDLRSPQKIKTELLEKYGATVAHRSCQQIKAAVKWGVENELIFDIDNLKWNAEKDFNFTIARDRVDIRPFTVSERDSIIEAFETDLFAKYKNNPHSQYSSAVKFWFFTGCRTGELLGLRWQDITDDYILFSHTRTETNSGEIFKKGLKQQDSRIFPVNIQLQEILSAVNLKSDLKSDYVFLDKRRNPVKLQNLVCCWKRVLEGLDLPYRRPYQCRHTFISICLNSSKLSPAEVGKLVGTSPAMIYKHYLGVSGNIEVPIL
ncbi:MAG: tyrosine-type recombinase/integrase [Okeania sp. SIO3B3]|nr:tyrosine-type recombinase/integrase [Okeania sp. SIO3B3]